MLQCLSESFFEENIPGSKGYLEKRQKEIIKHDVVLINQKLQKIIRFIATSEIKEKPGFKKELKKANENIYHSTALNIKYQSNYEDIKVAFVLVKFIFKVLPFISKERMQKDIIQQLDEAKRMLILVDSERMGEISRMELETRKLLNKKRPSK
jgi:hypothetical protein